MRIWKGDILIADLEDLEKFPRRINAQEAQTEQRTVHFAALMDFCHHKNAELEPKFQKYKRRVVLLGDIVKDDSGSYAVFTEQGLSASQMTAAKRNGCQSKAARMRRTSS